MKTTKPLRVVAAKAPVTTELEIEVPASSAASAISTQVSDIHGEFCSADFGSVPRLSLIASTSKLAEYFSPGQLAIANGIGDPVPLGDKITIIPLTASLWWLMDFGQEEAGAGGAPVRLATEQEVRDYGGTISRLREPGKVTFSRSMEIRLLLEDTNKADSTYLRLNLNGSPYLVALYEASRSAYRSVGVGLNLSWHNGHEVPHHRQWTLGIKSQRNKSLGTNYYVPTLTRGNETPVGMRAEIRQLIDRQLPA
jgi:hypothetical protein